MLYSFQYHQFGEISVVRSIKNKNAISKSFIASFPPLKKYEIKINTNMTSETANPIQKYVK